MSEIVFLSPLMFLALLALPILWWLLRFMPPKPRMLEFPGFFLLKDIKPKTNTSDYTLWWILLFRALMLFCFIAAFAEPVLNPSANSVMPLRGDVLMVVDNSWASAANWQKRKTSIGNFIKRAERANLKVALIASANEGKSELFLPVPAANAYQALENLKPQPWNSDYKEVQDKIARAMDKNYFGKIIFFSSGLTVPENVLNKVDVIISDKNINNPYVLRLKSSNQNIFKFSLERRNVFDVNKILFINIYDYDGNLLDEKKIDYPAGSKEYNFELVLPSEFSRKVSRIEVKGTAMASAVVLTGNSSNRHTVGVLSNEKARQDSQDLLNGYYYVEKALQPSADIVVDKLSELLNKNVSAIVMPDSTVLTGNEKELLRKWVESGGFLVRFAGSNLAASTDDALLPVPLRYGERSSSGSMTWSKPLKLAPIPEGSPLYGLEIPDDVEVRSQVLAEPSSDVFNKTWMQLEDGTPLVTGDSLGKGNVVLVHTTASPKWSNFCYSGLFVEMLQKLVMMSEGSQGVFVSENSLKPVIVVDGFGNISSITGDSVLKTLSNKDVFYPSSLTPPGIYGDGYGFKVFNLGDYLERMKAIKIPLNKNVLGYSREGGETELKSLLLKVGILMMVADTILALWFKGVFIALLLVVGFSGVAYADENFDPSDKIYLAYVQTGDKMIDSLSYNGLKGLSDIVNLRTAVKVEGVVGVNPDNSELIYYPFIYWPMASSSNYLSVRASQNIQNYLLNGGLILFDTRDGQFRNSGVEATIGIERLRDISRSIQIPELIKIPEDHILGRSFYLLDNYPGLYLGGDVWVEKEPSPSNDKVTSVVIGGNNWAAAWSDNPSDLARYIVEPGGEEQREVAYKFGINLLMVALTGNYKADQIHVSHILERIGR